MEKTATTILAVDDTEMNLDILEGILKKYDVIPALSGEDALEILQEEQVDLILLDIVMPGMDGFEVCRRIKADKRTHDIPVMFITVKSSEEDIKKCFELGIVDYIPKPFNAVELLARVETHLKLRSYQIRLEESVKVGSGGNRTGAWVQADLENLKRTTENMMLALEKKGPLDRGQITTACLEIQKTINRLSTGL